MQLKANSHSPEVAACAAIWPSVIPVSHSMFRRPCSTGILKMVPTLTFLTTILIRLRLVSVTPDSSVVIQNNVWMAFTIRWTQVSHFVPGSWDVWRLAWLRLSTKVNGTTTIKKHFRKTTTTIHKQIQYDNEWGKHINIRVQYKAITWLWTFCTKVNDSFFILGTRITSLFPIFNMLKDTVEGHSSA